MSKVQQLTLGDTADFINGMGFKQADWHGEGTPIIRIQNLTDHTKPFNETTREVPEKYHISNGDILVSWSATLDAFVWNRGSAYLNQHIFKVVPNPEIVQKKFLFYLLKFEIAALANSAHAHGSTMKHINRGPFLAHPVWIPPLAEQQAIVDEIETQFARLDDAEAALRRAEVRLNLLLKSSTEEMYRKSIVDLDACGASRALIPLGDLIETGPQNGMYVPASRYGSGTAILRIEDYQSDWMRPASDLKLIDIGHTDVEKYGLKVGDLVLNRVNSMTHLGKSAVVSDSHSNSVFESNMMRFHLKSHVDPNWVATWLNSPTGRQLLVQNAKWAVNQASINQTDVRNTPVPMAEGSTQESLLKELDSVVSKVTADKNIVSTNQKRIAHLRQAILKNAFEGNYGQ